MEKGIEAAASSLPGSEKILSPEALALVAELHRRFEPTREALLRRRAERLSQLEAGQGFRFLNETEAVRRQDFKVAAAPADLQKRHVEITGPVERKMIINALNSGADVFMADFEDSLAPTWSNVVQGQVNLMAAVRRTLEFSTDGKSYRLGDKLATLLVRPRGWHLTEKHVRIGGAAVSASLFDFALYFFHNARALGERKSGPYFYLPKMESHLEARLWNDVFIAAQELCGIPRGTIRATVLLETLPAAFEIDEILYELREHASGCNAGRWDYIFSLIKKHHHRPEVALPDRLQVTMTVPFMRAYTELLVQTCHKRGAHVIGGMAAFIPSRKNPEVNETALARVREDKQREASDGFDGTWVAHPDLVPVAAECFRRVLGDRPHQKERLREEVRVQAAELVDTRVLNGRVTEAGLRNNISVALQYLNAWLCGNGAVAIFNLMEDAATAEIARAQLWHWIRHGITLDDGRTVTRALYQQLRDEELAKLGDPSGGRLREAVEIVDQLTLAERFTEFLTLPAYERLE